MFVQYLSALLLCGSLVHSLSQDEVDNIGKNLGVRFKVVNNLNGNNENTDVSITLTNNGNQNIPPNDWEVYFYSFYKVEPNQINPDGVVVNGFNFTHVNGILFRFAPSGNGFSGLQTGQNHVIELVVQFWMVSRTDIMPRWYVTSNGAQPRVLQSTVNVYSDSFVAPFSEPKQYKRYKDDMYQPFTPMDRFSRHLKSKANAVPKPIIPTPHQSSLNASSSTMLTSNWGVSCGTYNAECQYLQDYFGLTGGDSATSNINLTTGSVDSIPSSHYQEEAYQLVVGSAAITITAPTAAGAFYGIESLKSLAKESGNSWSVPQGTVKDAPRFAYRGMHLDVGRNFVAKDDVLNLLKTMAMYKLNNFHFHLTDDEGWRVQMKTYPELTNIGSKRAHDLSETKSIIPQLGSGPSSNTSGSGFYTEKDYKDILTEAKKLHIRVIPEIDLPGHAHAAIKSHEAANHPSNESLTDPGDMPNYESVQLFTDNAVSPCVPGTYTFVRNVVSDLVELHKDIQPLTVFHLGGDEVAEAWANSPMCDELLNTAGFPEREGDLLEHFVRTASKEVLKVDNTLLLGLWEDGALNGSAPFDKSMITKNDVLTFAWQNIWEWGVANRAYKLANAGYKVVLSHATHLYFDQPYEPDPEERGLYWASRFTEASKTFGYMPDNVYSNADVKRSGEPYDRKAMCGEHDCTALEVTENIIGMQCQLFSETILSQENFHYMVYPRMLACAERAWHKADWEVDGDTKVDEGRRDNDWASFAAALSSKEFARLDQLGIAYRLTPPGLYKDSDTLKIGCEYPNMTVEYKVDAEWQTTTCGKTHKFPRGSLIEFRTAPSTNPTRFSRSVFSAPATQVAANLFLLIFMIIFAQFLTRY